MNPTATPPPTTAAPAATPTPSAPMTPQTFAASVRAKFPNGMTSDGKSYTSLSDQELTQRIITKYPVYQSKVAMPKAPAAQTLGTETADQVMGAGKQAVTDVTNAADRIQKGTQAGKLSEVAAGVGEAGLGTASDAVKAILAPISAMMKTASDAGSNIPGMQSLASSHPVSAVLDKVNALGSALDAIAAKHPHIAKDLMDAVNVAGAVAGPKVAPEAATAATAGDVGTSALKGLQDTAAGSEALAGKIAESAPMKTAVQAATNARQAVTSLPGKALDKVTSAVSGSPSLKTAAEGEGMVSKVARAAVDKQAAKADLAAQPEPVQNAVKAKIPQPVATFVHGLSDTEKATAAKMLDLQDAGMKNLSSKDRPESLIGQNVLERVKAIAKANEEAGKGTQGAVAGMADKPINYEGTAKTFMDHLDTLGIKPGEKGKLDFSGSQFDGPASAKNRNFLQAAYAKLSPAEDGTYVKPAKDLHIARQSLFQTIKDQPSADPFAGEATMAVNTARKGLLGDLAQSGDAGKAYKANATTYATTEKTLQDFYKLLGKKWAGKPEDALALKAGEVANRLKGNASADVNEMFDRLEQTAKDNGYKSSTSLANLADFNSILKQIVGDTQTNGFSGGITRGVNAALPEGADIAGHMAGSNGPVSAVKNALIATMKFTKGNARNEAVRALRKLLESSKTRTLEQGAPDKAPTVDETGGHIDLRGFQAGTPF